MTSQFGYYPAEKFSTAMRMLMLPHPKGESESIGYAFHECFLGLKNVPLDDLDEHARAWVQTLNRLMNTDGMPQSDRGAWFEKADRLTDEEKYELSDVVDELAHWFDRRSGIRSGQ